MASRGALLDAPAAHTPETPISHGFSAEQHGLGQQGFGHHGLSGGHHGHSGGHHGFGFGGGLQGMASASAFGQPGLGQHSLSCGHHGFGLGGGQQGLASASAFGQPGLGQHSFGQSVDRHSFGKGLGKGLGPHDFHPHGKGHIPGQAGSSAGIAPGLGPDMGYERQQSFGHSLNGGHSGFGHGGIPGGGGHLGFGPGGGLSGGHQQMGIGGQQGFGLGTSGGQQAPGPGPNSGTSAAMNNQHIAAVAAEVIGDVENLKRVLRLQERLCSQLQGVNGGDSRFQAALRSLEASGQSALKIIFQSEYVLKYKCMPSGEPCSEDALNLMRGQIQSLTVELTADLKSVKCHQPKSK